jgi:hypothetical protein
MRAPLTTYRYNTIGAPVQYSCHPSFPQLQDMQNPSFIVVERKTEKEKNYRIVCLHSHGHNAILTIVDHGCTRVAIFLPCTTNITVEGIAEL